MEYLKIFYFLVTLFTGIISLSLSVFVYLKTKATLIQYYLYLYSVFTLLVVMYTFSSYISEWLNESIIYTFVVLIILYAALIGMYYFRKLQDPERKILVIKSSVLIGISLLGIVCEIFLEEDSLIRIFPLLYCGVSVIATHYFLKYSLHQHPISDDTILAEEVFEQYNISPREQDIIRLIVQGYRNQEIADMLSVTVSTIKKHITKIYYKLEVKSRDELTTFFKNSGKDQIARTTAHDE